jgi:hypothetical protein
MMTHGLNYAAGWIANRWAEIRARRAETRARERVETDRFVRALGRVLLSGFTLGLLGYCLLKFMHAGKADEGSWFILGPTAAWLAVTVLRSLGGERGIVGGLWLSLLSLGLVTGAVALWLAGLGIVALGGGFVLLGEVGDPGNWRLFGGYLVIGAVLVGSCEKALKRAEEQTP